MQFVLLITLGPTTDPADVAASLEFQFGTAHGTGIDDLPFGFRRHFLHALNFNLQFLPHVNECISDRGRTAGTFACVALRERAYRVRRTGSAAL